MSNKYTPTPVIIRTALDEIGSQLDVVRIDSEDLVTYRDRLYSVYSERGGSTYSGLINAMNRELGLKKKDVLRVDLKSLYQSTLDGTIHTLLNDVIRNDYLNTDTINGSSIIATGTQFTNTLAIWPENQLVGHKLSIYISYSTGVIYTPDSIVEINLNSNHSNIIESSLKVYIGLVELNEDEYILDLQNKKITILANPVNAGIVRFEYISRYTIKDNTSTSLTINGSLSDLVGYVYTIDIGWEVNELIGLGLKLNNQLYKIVENNTSSLRLDKIIEENLNNLEYKIVAYNPKIEVTGSSMYLYNEYINKENFQLERRIDLRSDVVYHSDIVNIINNSKFFVATNLLEYGDNVFAKTLKHQSSENIIINEKVPATKMFKFLNNQIKIGSVNFIESNIFLYEVEKEDVSKKIGNYYIDYNNGVVFVHSLPSGNKTVSYIWNDFPFTIISSPVILNTLNDSSAQEFLFTQTEMQKYNNLDEKYISTQPKADMLEYISELINIKPQSWGQ